MAEPDVRVFIANQTFAVPEIGIINEGFTYELDVIEWEPWLRNDHFFRPVTDVPDPPVLAEEPAPEPAEGDDVDDGVT